MEEAVPCQSAAKMSHSGAARAEGMDGGSEGGLATVGWRERCCGRRSLDESRVRWRASGAGPGAGRRRRSRPGRSRARRIHFTRQPPRQPSPARPRSCRSFVQKRSDHDDGSSTNWAKSTARAAASGRTGQIEGLYLLRRGVAEHLVTEGFESVRAAHSVGSDLRDPDDRTLRGLLEDQQETLETVLDLARGGAPLRHTTIRALHAILTRHQDTATGIHGLTGEGIRIPLRKGGPAAF